MAKGDDESWFRTKDAATMEHRDTMSVLRVTSFAQDTQAAKRPYPAEPTLTIHEGGWLPRRKGAADGATHRPNLRRSQSKVMDQAAVVLCCCGGGGGPRWSRKYDTVEANLPDEVLRTKGRWDVDADEEFYKRPVWKQVILKVRAQARQVNCRSKNSGEWVNYDSQSYEKNFDNGSWRDNSRDFRLPGGRRRE